MTLAGAFFILFGVTVALRIRFPKGPGSNILPIALFSYHLGFSCIYYWYTFTNEADAIGYYASTGTEFGVGTRFIEWITTGIRDTFSASFLDLFFLFHIFGFIGLCLVYKTVHEVSLTLLQGRARRLLVLFVFFPGLHFWTSAIGKDSLIFMGIMLCIWGILNPRNRAFAICTGLILIFMVRPHVAGLFVLSAGLPLLMSKNLSLQWRILGFVAVALLFAGTLPFIIEYIGLESTNTQTVAEYINQRQGHNQEGGGGVDMSNYPFPLQFLTYLYRPLFFDAPGVLGLIVSMENLMYLCLSMLLLTRGFRRVLKNHPNVFFIRFNLVYWLITSSVLAATTANLGIAIRQKIMVMPSLIILLVITYAVRQHGKARVNRSRGATGLTRRRVINRAIK